MEIEDVKAKATEASPSPSPASGSASLSVAVGPTKLIADKLREISALQTEREELASKLALNLEIEHRAIQHMTGAEPYSPNSAHAYGYGNSPEYGPSSPILARPGERMMQSMRGNAASAAHSLNTMVPVPVAQNAVMQPGGQVMMMPGQQAVMMPGQAVMMPGQAMMIPMQPMQPVMQSVMPTTTQSTPEQSTAGAGSSAPVDNAGKKTITFK